MPRFKLLASTLSLSVLRELGFNNEIARRWWWINAKFTQPFPRFKFGAELAESIIHFVLGAPSSEAVSIVDGNISISIDFTCALRFVRLAML